MLRTIEYIDLAGDSLRRDEVGVLRHIPRTVHLTLMVDFLDDLDARLGRNGMSSELATLVIVVGTVELVRVGALVAFGELHLRDLEVVLRLAGGVRAEEQAVDRVRLVWRSVAVWSSTSCESVVVKRTILCRGTIDTSGWASQGRGLSLRRTSTARSSSC